MRRQRALRLLDITEFFSPTGGGVRTYLDSKSRWLAEHSDIDHVIVLPSNRFSSERWHRSRVYYVEGSPLPASPGYFSLTASGAIQSIFEQERPDLVEVGSPFLAPWVSRRAARSADPVFVGYYHCDVPSVYVDFGLRTLPSGIRRSAKAVLRRYLATVYGRMHHTVAATPSATRALHSLGLKSVSTIPLGVNTELFSPARRDEAWKQEVGAEASDPVVLYSGRFAAEKGLDVVISALPRLIAESKLSVVLIGEGHMRDGLCHVAERFAGRLTVLPYESDRKALARAYASADIYVAPFPYETFGLSAVESMACGTPVVGADSGALTDLLGDSDCGFRFEPGNPHALANQILGMLDTDLNDLGTRARDLVERRYDWNQTFGAMFDLYADLVATNQKTP